MIILATEEIEIDIDTNEIKKKLNKLKGIKKGSEKALKLALNETVKKSREPTKKAIKENYTVGKVKNASGNTAKNGLAIKKATQRDLSVSVYTQGRPNSLTKFKYRKNGKKVSVWANPKKSSSGGRTGGFMTHVYTGTGSAAANTHLGIFKRKGDKVALKFGKLKGKVATRGINKGKIIKRQKIVELFGPGLAQMLNNDDTKKTVSKEMLDKFNEELTKAIDKIIADSLK